MRNCVLVGIFALTLVAPPDLFAASAPSSDEKLTPKQAEAKLKKSCWQELNPSLPKEKQPDPFGGVEWHFGYSKPTEYSCIDWENEASQELGEFMLDAKVKPMRLDYSFHDAGKDWVVPAIFRFDGEKLIWVIGKRVEAKVYDAASGEVKGRPKDFATPPKVGYIRTMRRSRGN